MKPISLKKPLVTLSAISKKFDGKSIISSFDLNIHHGEFITLLGPSGCGKTTILRLIAGLEEVDSGRIFLDEHDITNIPAEQRHTNTVFQSYALFPHMSVFENIAFGLRMKKVEGIEITKRVNQVLLMVQMDGLADRRPHQLSGGQQQRVAIARAIVNRPKVLLLDESLSALDYKLRRQMQNELKALQRKLGITFIFVTHDQEEALAISDRIVVMRDGKIEQQGTPREIYEKPNNLFVASFIGEINVFYAKVMNRDNAPIIRVHFEGHECDINCPFSVKIGEKIYVLLRPEDLRVKGMNNNNCAGNYLVGYVRARNYKGMILESIVELENGKMLTISEFFNEDNLDYDDFLNQKIIIKWIPNREMVLPYEHHV
ncbi:spermidine/putrescine ABC transporter ATP-binding protein PotA [Pantoea sp. Aalb]|uniref:spermidine/putrescine ABC transporter ATP-binding protein PotA n=1 Tax=Pantoea sp. Aalb TaxID=2576762 RepID=UPI0013239547|nr:spermidine/putrescine ABC transporter ATP-binding protein PotA [Pantoea sp. Aalb]MXP67448.1 spermidine/putrescine ABC transporter ATP-binding protein PotA [Pantoea sp. Aalb]